MYHQLQKAINLAKKTGDRLLIFDPKNVESIFAVMSLDEYEKLVIGKSEVRDLTEDELLDKINRDIAIWKSEQDLEKNTEKRENAAIDLWPAYEYKENGGFKKLSEIKTKMNKDHWRIPKERKLGAEEIIEEDRQYLETL